MSTTAIQQRLTALGISLPPVSVPAAAYVPFVQSGNLVFISGHIAKRPDGSVWQGQLGLDTDTATGQQAARAIAIDLLGTLQAACGGDLGRVKRVVKLMSLVNSTASYTDQHLVTNCASELMHAVFGPEVGAHARSAFGVAQIPRGACVEIEMIAEIE
jgi:enamine deaminase RidA (YjgF/YER057c/UK114 family)